mmetsp:Transcript_17999/g.29819  ORF Transcript_17999/g.29819 Transcript_17999/m.29819 type:complete len:127 (+) Transcript_17999:194-574(+)
MRFNRKLMPRLRLTSLVKRKKSRARISFDEYEMITNAVTAHLRSLESDVDVDVDADGNEKPASYLSWGEVVDWYLEEYEQDIGESSARRDELKKKVNLVIRRLINVDRFLITVGDAPKHKRDEPKT